MINFEVQIRVLKHTFFIKKQKDFVKNKRKITNG